jgi:hypothetical protein
MLGTLDDAIRRSTMLRVAEWNRLGDAIERAEAELKELERLRHMATTREQSLSVQAQIEQHSQALAALRQQQANEQAAENARLAEEAARARRAAATGHAAELMDAHASKLAALDEAEQHMLEAVRAINAAIRCEAAERTAVGALAVDLNVRTESLTFSKDEFIRRLISGLSSHLVQISAVRMRRLGHLVFPDDPRQQAGGTWAEREAKATGESVEVLLTLTEKAEAA